MAQARGAGLVPDLYSRGERLRPRRCVQKPISILPYVSRGGIAMDWASNTPSTMHAKNELTAEPAAPNAGIAPRLTIQNHWPGLGALDVPDLPSPPQT